MIQVDLPAAFTFGHIFAYVARKYLKSEPNLFTNRFMGPVNFFFSCFFAPGGVYFLVSYSAWEGMYVTGWTEAPFNRPLTGLFYVAFMCSMIILGNVGFILGHNLLKKGKDLLVKIGIGVGVFLTLLPYLVRWGVWWKIGTYQEVTSGGGYSFWDPPFVYGFMFMMSYVFISAFIFAHWLKKKSNSLTQ